MKRQIRKMLMGDTVFSEYSRIIIPGDVDERVWLETEAELIDVSGCHWLLCIEPLVFGVWIGPGETSGGQYRLRFSDAAVIMLELVHRIEEHGGQLLLLRVKHCQPAQLDPIRRWLLYFRYYRRDGMSYERFKGFVSAYSYPRKVHLVSFREDDHYNIFPMDLLGEMPSQNNYVFGLRHSNRTLSRIIATGKIVVSEVSAAYKDIVYQLGKHHSSDPPSPEDLPFDIKLTRQFGYYVPGWVQGYREVRIRQTFNMGSHMLLWGEIEAEEWMGDSDDHLYLVHFLQYLHQKNKGVGYTLA